MNKKLDVKIINRSGFELPKYETAGGSGIDLRSTEHIGVPPGSTKLIKTGIFLGIPEGFEAQVRPRSGLALKKSITVLNTPGTIDSDYRGEVGVILINHSKEMFVVKEGDRIAQLVFQKIEHVNFVEVNDVDKTERGSGGFGSTGNS